MTRQTVQRLSPRIQEAVAELEGLISAHYPDATYEVLEGSDPNGVWIMAEVDVEDLLDVADVVAERELELQVDEGLPLYVFPTRPVQRVGIAESHDPAPLRTPKLRRHP